MSLALPCSGLRVLGARREARERRSARELLDRHAAAQRAQVHGEGQVLRPQARLVSARPLFLLYLVRERAALHDREVVERAGVRDLRAERTEAKYVRCTRT